MKMEIDSDYVPPFLPSEADRYYSKVIGKLQARIAKLESALSAPASAEPVAYAEKDGDESVVYWPGTGGTFEHIRDYPHLHDGITPLYAAKSLSPLTIDEETPNQ